MVFSSLLKEDAFAFMRSYKLDVNSVKRKRLQSCNGEVTSGNAGDGSDAASKVTTDGDVIEEGVTERKATKSSAKGEYY